MGRIFDPETPIMQWLQKIATVIFCGFFWLLCCIPIITAGASTTAMFRMMFNLREDKPARTGDFFRVFAEEFGKSTILWLLQLISGGILVYISLLLSGLGTEGIEELLLITLMVFLFACWLFTFSFVYPLTAYFENTVFKTIANGLLMAFGNRHQSIPIIALSMIPLFFAFGTAMFSWDLFYYAILYILPIWLFVIIPLIVYAQSGLFLTIFAKYVEAKPAEISAAEEKL